MHIFTFSCVANERKLVLIVLYLCRIIFLLNVYLKLFLAIFWKFSIFIFVREINCNESLLKFSWRILILFYWEVKFGLWFIAHLSVAWIWTCLLIFYVWNQRSVHEYIQKINIFKSTKTTKNIKNKLTETETLEFIWRNKKQEKFVLKFVNFKNRI
jgi:hypothetical protein